jgi:hypothetical protein
LQAAAKLAAADTRASFTRSPNAKSRMA